MSLLPKQTMSWRELRYWEPSRRLIGNLEGKAVESLDELKKEFLDVPGGMRVLKTAEERYGIVSGYTIYGFIHNLGLHQPLAYLCQDCDKIVIGMPEIKDVDDISCLAGRRGYDVYCTNCHGELDSFTFVRS